MNTQKGPVSEDQTVGAIQDKRLRNSIPSWEGQKPKASGWVQARKNPPRRSAPPSREGSCEKIQYRLLPARSVRRSARSTRWNARSARVFGCGFRVVMDQDRSIQFFHSFKGRREGEVFNRLHAVTQRKGLSVRFAGTHPVNSLNVSRPPSLRLLPLFNRGIFGPNVCHSCESEYPVRH